jgi:translation initiation factor 3 subunit C
VRLADEATLVELSEMILKYYVRIKDNRAAAHVALLHAEHIYYKHDNVSAAVQRAHLFNKTWGKYADLHPASLGKVASAVNTGNKDEFEGKRGISKAATVHPASFLGNPTVVPPAYDAAAKLEELSHFIFKHGDDRSRTRALLCSVYHHALHDRFHRARDMFLISHIQDGIDKADTKTQILYNRALVTLGLSAFRQGLIQKAHDCLAGICTNRVRELLAQGQNRWPDKDPEQERIERRRQMPYHMHINPDLLDCCHLISAMLLELPSLARGNQSTQNPISRNFRKYLASYSRQKFTGPPENTRDHVLASTKCLLEGEWKRACGYLLNLEVWNLIPGDGGVRVKEMLRIRLKEEALRTYLLTYGAHYDSMSLTHLCTMFEMDETPARRIISRMIFNKEISGAWEHQPPDTLVLYRVDPSPVQTVSLQVAEKVAALVESNERMLDPLVNVYGYKDDQRKWGGDRDRDGMDRRKGLGYNNANKPHMRQPPRQGGGGRGGGRGYRRPGGDNRDGPRRVNEGSTSNYRAQRRAEVGVASEQQQQPQPNRRAGWGSNA